MKPFFPVTISLLLQMLTFKSLFIFTNRNPPTELWKCSTDKGDSAVSAPNTNWYMNDFFKSRSAGLIFLSYVISYTYQSIDAMSSFPLHWKNIPGDFLPSKWVAQHQYEVLVLVQSTLTTNFRSDSIKFLNIWRSFSLSIIWPGMRLKKR